MTEGWRKVTFGDVVRLSKERVNPRREHNTTRCVELEHIEGETGRLLGSIASGDQLSPKTVFSPNDVLFGKLRPYLRKYLVPGFFGVCSSEIWVFRPDSRYITTGFLYALVQTDGFMKEVNRSSGSKMPRADWNILSRYRFGLPPLSEQREIGEILRTWDDAIEKLESLRAAKLDHRNWLKQNLLTGRKRLPGFSREWRIARLNEILTEHRLQSTGSEEVYSVSVHQGLVNQIEHLGRSYASTNTALYNRVLPGDIVYTKSPTGDFPFGIIKQSKIRQEVIVSPLYGVFTPDTQELGVMLDAYFESPILTRNFLHPLVQKGAKNTIAITNSRFLEGKFCVPLDLDEQRAIAVAIETSKSELSGIDREIKMLACQKRGLVQKLLTGEWRVMV